SRLVPGNGESYGIEFFFHKKVGRMSGWLGYTLSKTENQFDQINQGKAFAANYDRRHDISLFNTFKFSEGTDLSFNWIFGSGYPVTLPTQKYYSPDLPTQPGLANGSGHDLIEGRNNFRMPAIHRLDLGLNFTSQKSWGTRIWSFGIYNTYSRQNPFFLYFGEKVDAETNTTVRVLKQYSIFPIPLPYARVTIKF
ncbi:MAG: TonB-dependent receptor, partial [Breznakibacter sp.]|nr:TonB-dependent receptor [Breznakibacter sp.]